MSRNHTRTPVVLLHLKVHYIAQLQPTIPKKSAAVKKMSMAVVGRTLHWTKIGERQTVRAVSHLSSFPHFAKGCSSGAVAVEMEGLLFCALNAKSFHFVLSV